MSANKNADDYAHANLNRFFTANNETSGDGNLTGQCVTLIKWFMQDMANVPNPFAARGDARYVGQTLVRQGLADEVAYSDRRRGDIICYEYGLYGHIAVKMSDDKVFEENVNWSGVASRVVDGGTVYASRIGSDNEAWRATKNPHVYRLKSYNEGATMTTPTIETLRIGHVEIGGWPPESYDGRNDALFTAAAGWKEVNAFIYEQFMAGGGYRDLKKKYQDFYVEYSPQIAGFQAAVEQNKVLTQELAEANQKLAAYENGDTIVITRKGFNGLFDVIKQFFAKNN